MPFPEQTPRRLTRDNVLRINPRLRGCYGLFRYGMYYQKIWIYIGQGNIRDRLLDHLFGETPHVTEQNPSHWVDIVTDDFENEARRLILELDPIVNRRWG